MKLQQSTISVVIAAVLGLAGPAVAQAQSASNASNAASPAQAAAAKKQAEKKQADKKKAETLGVVYVVGDRAGLDSAESRKRYADQLMDSIVATDIGKLPDTNVADALQRVTGVQVTQDEGEGSTVAIRGLTEIETQLNGNTIFTAAGARSLNFEDIPAELMAGVDVYKSPTPDQVEGGIGGIVDLRTHRPFDFDGFKAAASVGGEHASLAGKTKPRVSGLLSDTWNTDIGKVGALVALSYQERPFMERYTEMTHSEERTDLGTSTPINAPMGEYLAYNYGTRTRLGINGSLQWQPTDNLQFYMDSYLAKFKSHGNTQALYTDASFGSGYDMTVYPGTDDFKSGTFTDVGVEPESFTQDMRDRTYQVSTGGNWHDDALTLSGNVSYTNSVHSQNFNELSMYATIPSFTVDTSGTVPVTSYNGFDLTDASNYKFNTINYYYQRNTGAEKTARFDASYDTTSGFFQTFKAGLRTSDRTATNASVNDVQWESAYGTNYFGQTANVFQGLLVNSPSGIGTWVDPDPDAVRDAASLFNLFNLGSLPSADPLSIFDLAERTQAAYVMTDFGAGDNNAFSGNLGVRAVRTEESVSGSQSLDGVISPLSKSSNYWNVLPTLNLQYDFTDTLQARFDASKTVTRPDFSQLSPSLTLTTYFLTGSAGNPNLQPMKANNLDASLGWYFDKGGYLFGDVFFKSVKGFIAYTTDLETYYGQQYQISRPINSNDGTIRGAEMAYQQWFDFLPDAWHGFGAQFNYTYVDSQANGIIPGQTTPLENLSKNTYNAILMYENHGVSARLAYNWRSGFLSSTYYTNTSLEPIYMNSYGILDAYVGYEINPHVTLGVDMVNLLGKHMTSYYLRPTMPDESYLEDRRITATVRVKF